MFKKTKDYYLSGTAVIFLLFVLLLLYYSNFCEIQMKAIRVTEFLGNAYFQSHEKGKQTAGIAQ